MILGAIALLSCSAPRAQVVINELMQSNVDCIMDDLNDFPDSWVEIYNTGSTAVNLSQYSIGLTDDASAAWQLPTTYVSVKGFAIIYCDKVGSGMHTNFKLDSGKGACVYLFKDGQVIDKITDLAKQPAPNISYGRKTDGADEWGYQSTPTPNGANCGTICKEILGDPVFSEGGKVFTGSSTHSYSISISLPEGAPAGTIIRYTTDGSEPTSTSTKYTSAITGSTTKIIRAKLFCDGYLSPRSVTQSYIVFPREMTLPVVSIVTNTKYFNDNKVGILVDGTYNSSTKNYSYDWRRPINFELFDTDGGESALNQLCETRVGGNASRGCSLKSMIVYANKRFGEKHLKYEFFPDQRPGLKKYKSIILRNAGNDFDYLYMRDIIAQRSMATYKDIDWQAWRPAIVYINGTYKGILNIRERGNEDNIYTNYDGLEDVDVAETYTIKEGDDVNLKAFQAFYNEHGHTWDEYSKWIDLDEFINIMIMNSYYNNIDFPANNFMLWRPRTEDGRWRSIAKDVDYILGIYGQQAYNYGYISWLNNNSYDSNYSWGNTYDGTRLFRRLEEDETFKRNFIDRFAIYMGDFLNYDNVWTNIWEPMYNIIKTEYPNHRKLINQWWPTYTDELSKAQTWMKNRTNFMYSHLASYYSLGTATPLIINESASKLNLEDADIFVNGVSLTSGKFNGKFYAGRSLTLSGAPKEGKTIGVIGWNITTVSTTGTVTTKTVNESTYTFTMPTCTRLIISANFANIPNTGNSNAIDNITMDYASDEESNAEIYDASGARRYTLQRGVNIVKTINGEVKKIIVK